MCLNYFNLYNKVYCDYEHVSYSIICIKPTFSHFANILIGAAAVKCKNSSTVIQQWILHMWW